MKTPEDKIEIVQGDITTLDVDAIVNAANSTLLGSEEVEWTAQFIAVRDPTCSPNAEHLAVVNRVKQN